MAIQQSREERWKRREEEEKIQYEVMWEFQKEDEEKL